MHTHAHTPACSAWITLASAAEHLLCTRPCAINWGNSMNNLPSVNYVAAQETVALEPYLACCLFLYGLQAKQGFYILKLF